MSQEAYDYGPEPEAQQGSRRPLWIGAGIAAAILLACGCVLCFVATYLVLSNTEDATTPTAPPAVSVDQIVNIQWQWTEWVESQPAGQSLVPDPVQYVTVFRPDGQLPVKADCNVAQGAYRAEGARLAVNMGPITTALCPPGSLSARFVELLANADSFVMEGGLLVIGLRDAAGRMVFRNGGPAEAVTFAPAATAIPTGEPAPGSTPTDSLVPQPAPTEGPVPEPTATGGPEPQPTPTSGDLPQPVIVAPSEASPGEVVTFDASQSQPGSSPITAYGWEFGDGNSAEGITATHAYGQPGSYIVTLMLRDEAGTSNSATMQITVREEATPTPEPPSVFTGELVGPAWKWIELNQGSRSVVPNPERYRLRFYEGGLLDYVADCISGGATYVVEGDGLRIDLGTAESVECGPNSLSKEFLEYIGSVVGYELDGSRLNLRMEGAGGYMAFVP